MEDHSFRALSVPIDPCMLTVKDIHAQISSKDPTDLKTRLQSVQVQDLSSEHMASLVEEDLELQQESEPAGDPSRPVAIVDDQFINLCAIGGQF